MARRGSFNRSLNERIYQKLIVLISTLIASGAILANPVGGEVTAGSATITQTPGNTQINQTSDKAIINWNSFNIGAAEKTHFQQPNTNSITLNRIDPSQGVSEIYGSLSSTGRLILVNQAGIYFGPSARVDVGGIIASTVGISDANFLAGKYIFDQTSSMYQGSVINQGTIIAANHGLVALVGSNVSNEGYIQANRGNIVLASGSKFTVDFVGDGLIHFAVDAPASNSSGKPAVNNSGKLIADGGKIVMTAKAAEHVLDKVVNMSGVAEARSVYEHDGEIILDGGESGVVHVTGIINAFASLGSNAKGGIVKILGADVRLESAEINVSGDIGGGKILVGGNFYGAGPERNAVFTLVDASSSLNANALTRGNGGQIAVWSDAVTNVHGNISAQGGVFSGNGGMVETSGHYLNIHGVKVSTLAPAGKTGNWLLDPSDLTICTSCTTTATSSSNTYSNNASNSNLLVTDLTSALASNNITVQTTNTGSGGNGDIFVNTNITWASANSLTLSAYRNITSTATITNTGGGSVVLRADNTGTGTGTVSFSGGNNVALSGGSGTVSVYYNPTTFGTQDTIYTGGTTATRYMLINSLGTSTDSATTATLGALSNNSSLWSGNFALGADIDASATSTWNTSSGINAIGNSTTAFTGNFDGQFFTISNLFKSSLNLQGNTSGFFGTVNTSGTIKNLILRDLNFSAPQFNIVTFGGLMGTLTAGTVTSIAIINPTLSSISNFNSMGGIIGLVNGGTLSNSYVQGGSVIENNITGTNPTVIRVGGAVGVNVGTISNVYSTAKVEGYRIAGGLVGQNNTGTISSSFSTGPVSVTSTPTSLGGLVGQELGTTSNSYWDTDTSGRSTSAAGTGKTTAQLQQTLQTGFSASTWGIIAGDGTAANGSYPYLSTFFSSTPRVISGTVPSGTTSGSTIKLAYNGSVLDTSIVGANGFYYFLEENGAIANSAPFLVYLSGSNNQANIVGLAPASDASAVLLNMTADNTINIYGNTTAITNTNLGTALGALSSTDILYSASGANLTVGNATNTTVDFYTRSTSSNNAGTISTAATTYTIDGTIARGNSGNATTSLTFSGPVNINTTSVTTSGLQNYQGNIVLGASPTLTGSVITLGSSGSNTITNGGNTLILANTSPSTMNSILSGTGGLTLSSSSTLSLLSANTFTGATTILAGTLANGVANALPIATALSVTGIFDLAGFAQQVASVAGSGTVTDSGAAAIFTINNSSASSFNGTLAGNLSLTKSSTGTLTLNGASTYSGATTVNAGVLNVANATGLSTSAVTVASGAELDISGVTINNAITLNGGTLGGIGTSSLSGNITLGGASTISASNSSDALTLSGTINGGSALTLSGSGSVTMAGVVGGSTPLSSLTSNAGTTVLSNNVTTSGSQTYNNAVSLNGSPTLSSSGGDFTFGSTITGNGNNLTISGSGNSSLTLQVGNAVWTVSAANAGSIAGIIGSGVFSFSGIKSLLGGSGTNSFILSGGTLSGLIFGGSSGNNTLTADNINNIWTLTSANAGTVTGVTGGFTFIQNLVGGSSSDSFTLNGGTLSGLINGSGGSNTLTGGNVANTWTLSGANAGSLTGLGSGFSSIQNLVGNAVSDTFIFNNGSSISGNLVGGSGSATMDLSRVGSNITLTLTGSGSSHGSQGTSNVCIGGTFNNIDTAYGNGNSNSGTQFSIVVPNKSNQVYITGSSNAVNGYIADPFAFNNATTIVGQGSTTITFNVSALLNASTGEATINGKTINFSNISPDAYFGNFSVQSTSDGTEVSAVIGAMTQSSVTLSNTSSTSSDQSQSETSDSSESSSSSSTVNTPVANVSQGLQNIQNAQTQQDAAVQNSTTVTTKPSC